ncbi:MAG: hypothetical protein SF187_03705 [Deltaproteobacteria bacterium]|nr:hypothetical protein [Deltaproteobacteria bacterium]
MFRRPPSLHLPVLLASLLPLLATACGNDLADGDFGGVDLQPFFYDSTAEKPRPPVSYGLKRGFLDGAEVSYFEFGWSAARRDTPDDDRRTLLGLGPTDKIPKVAPVNPMYFFFDSKGNPMFAAPIREKKTGNFVLPGGLDLRNPNPAEKALKDVAYAVRSRDPLTDPLRGTADYQRPIIDVIYDRFEDEPLEDYSGLWEFVKVIAPSGYQPDQIKSWRTLEKGVESGDFKLVTSAISDKTELLAINCPIVDSRSLVLPNLSIYSPDDTRIPQPRMELWYRRKRVDCFLVNGWETLGKTEPSADGNDKYVLYKASEDDQRIGVLDTDLSVLGEGSARKRQVVAPLGQVFIPRLTARAENFFVDNNFVTTGSLPRRKKDDPTGYRPVRWWWNLSVSDFGEGFSDGTLKDSGMTDVRKIDDSKLSPRESVTINLPLTSKRIPCDGATVGNDLCEKFGLVCGLLTGSQIRFCETKTVRYGETCAPTIATCRGIVESGEVAGSKADVVEKWFVNGTGTPAELTAAGVAQEWIDAQTDLVRQSRRIVTRGNAPVYSCLAEAVSQVGSCYLSCNGANANLLQNAPPVKEMVQLDDGRTVEINLELDSRCGGTLMPGFRCLPIRDATTDKGGAWCLRDCNPGSGADYNKGLCQRSTPAYLSDQQIGIDIAKNTSCQSINLADPADTTQVETTFGACIRDQAFAPF